MSVDEAATPVLAELRQARGRKDATVRWLYLLTPVFLLAFAVPAFASHPGPGLAGRHLIVSVAVGAFVVGVLGRNATARHPFTGAHIGFVVVLLAGAVALMAVQPNGPGPEAVLLAALCIARLLPVRVAIPVLAITFVVLELITGLTDRNFGNLAVVAVLGALYGLLFLAFRLSEATKQAERLLAELEQSRAAQARAAGLAERQRLAREMHDVLAHSLTGLLLQLEGARMLATAEQRDPRLPDVIDRAHRLGRTGLDEARRAIGMLRDDDLPGPELLPALAAQFEQDHGIPTRLTVCGQVHPLGAEARLALYRVAQEALTNIAKHASPGRAELQLDYERSGTRLRVEDFAAPHDVTPPPDDSATGYGLTGMRERAELLGGTLTARRTDTGFRVELDVPA